MSTTTLLRAASLLALIQYIAHAFLFLSVTSGGSPLFGYGLMVILSGLIEVALLWQIASLANDQPIRTRPIIALFIFANLAHAFLAWQYFRLIAPVAFDMLIAVILGLAFISAQRKVA